MYIVTSEPSGKTNKMLGITCKGQASGISLLVETGLSFTHASCLLPECNPSCIKGNLFDGLGFKITKVWILL